MLEPGDIVVLYCTLVCQLNYDSSCAFATEVYSYFTTDAPIIQRVSFASTPLHRVRWLSLVMVGCGTEKTDAEQPLSCDAE
jgi:hypothetical protein